MRGCCLKASACVHLSPSSRERQPLVGHRSTNGDEMGQGVWAARRRRSGISSIFSRSGPIGRPILIFFSRQRGGTERVLGRRRHPRESEIFSTRGPWQPELRLGSQRRSLTHLARK